MPWYEFIWDDENGDHLAQNGVAADEFVEIVCNPGKVETSRSTGRPIAFGRTTSGKYIACVYEMIGEFTVYPITACELDG